MEPDPRLHFSRDELLELGLRSVGDSVLVDRSCRLYGARHIEFGSHVRLDAFCVLSAGPAGMRIGSFVHFSVGVTVLGRGRFTAEDFSGLSARVSIFTSNEDYSGAVMTNPTVPDRYRNATSAPVVLGRHSIVGASSVIMPGVTIGVGAAVGALSFVRRDVPDFQVVSGNPLRRVGERKRDLLSLESALAAATTEASRTERDR